jgi:outer membrane protein
MKRFITALGITLMFTLAAGTLSAQDTKIVYIDSQRILYESAAGKEAMKQLNTMKEQKEAEVQKRQSKLKSMGESIQAKSATMTPAAKDDLEAQYEREAKDLQRYIKDAQDEFRGLEMKFLKPLNKEIDDSIKIYSEKNGVDLVLDKTNPVVIYASSKIDVTNQIMEILNKRYQDKSGKAKAKKE